MAKPVDRLVTEIRDERRRLWGDGEDGEGRIASLRGAVGKAPVVWLTGAAIAGFFLGRWLLPKATEKGRTEARVWLRRRLRDVGVALLLVAVGSRVAKRKRGPEGS